MYGTTLITHPGMTCSRTNEQKELYYECIQKILDIIYIQQFQVDVVIELTPKKKIGHSCGTWWKLGSLSPLKARDEYTHRTDYPLIYGSKWIVIENNQH